MQVPTNIFFCLFILACSLPARAQPAAFRVVGTGSAAEEIFEKGMQHNLPLYCGPSFTGYGQNISGSAFFDGDSLLTGDIQFDGILYRNVRMGYDLVSDQVLVKDFTNNLLLILSNTRIGYFRIHDHLFIRNTGAQAGEAGFFELAYNGRHAVYIKRKRQLMERISDDRVRPTYEDYDTYYLNRGDRIIRISRSGYLFRAFADKKATLRKYLHLQKLQFKQNPEQTLLAAARFYDSH